MDVSYNINGLITVTVDGTAETIGFRNFGTDERISSVIYKYSPNQRKTIIAKTEKLIDAYDTGDCPTMLRLLLSALKEVKQNERRKR